LQPSEKKTEALQQGKRVELAYKRQKSFISSYLRTVLAHAIKI